MTAVPIRHTCGGKLGHVNDDDNFTPLRLPGQRHHGERELTWTSPRFTVRIDSIDDDRALRCPNCTESVLFGAILRGVKAARATGASQVKV